LVHVLEHIQDLDGFLQQVRMRLRKGGYLFVEVPDSIEFDRLKKEDDDFNSCHQWSFDLGSLYKVLEKNGFDFLCCDPPEGSYAKPRLRLLCN